MLTSTRVRWVLSVPLAIASAIALDFAAFPLQWLIGPMLSCAACNMLGAGFSIPAYLRFAGQSMIGMALGLYFSIPVLTQVGLSGGWIGLSLAMSIPTTLLAANILAQFPGIDRPTAYYACTTGGAAEMANLAEGHGASTDVVATAHTLRVVLVVTFMPFLFNSLDVHGSEIFEPIILPFTALGLAAQYSACLLAGILLYRLRIPNAWLFGPLLISVSLTASGVIPSSVPVDVTNLAQLLIGISLGGRFCVGTIRSLKTIGIGLMAAISTLLITCALTGLVIYLGSGIPIATALLATAPGGLAEMAVTAKVLQLGVPVVVAFHTTRLVFTVLSAGLIYRIASRGWRPPES